MKPTFITTFVLFIGSQATPVALPDAVSIAHDLHRLPTDVCIKSKTLDVRSVAPTTTNSWRNVACDFGSLTSAGNDPVQQFIDSQTTYAYSEMWTAWTNNATAQSIFAFPDYVTDYFHGPPAIACELLTETACDVSTCSPMTSLIFLLTWR
jgi:hypothetical protein